MTGQAASRAGQASGTGRRNGRSAWSAALGGQSRPGGTVGLLARGTVGLLARGTVGLLARGTVGLLARGTVGLLAGTLAVTGCGMARGGPAAAPGPSTAAARTPGAAGHAPGTPSAASDSAAPAAGAATAASSSASPAGPAARDTVRQLVVVSAASYGATSAALTAYRRVSGGWHRVLGPWPAWIGRSGMAPPGAKREGDGRTPSGTFRLGFLFGTGPDPGFRFRYRQSYGYDVWDDDPASPRYNEWVDTRYRSAGAGPEPMDVSAYDYGVVIGYNTARTPGLGSAIFLHINIGMPTAGCVTLPEEELLTILRWLNPARSPRIEMGVAKAAGPG